MCNLKISIQTFDEACSTYFNTTFLHDINRLNSIRGTGSNKLRTYCTMKFNCNIEIYLKMPLAYSQRSALAKFRCGVAPLRLETGWYTNTPVNERLCLVCGNGIEDEKLVILHCDVYTHIRYELFNKTEQTDPLFNTYNDPMKLVFLLSDNRIYLHTARALNLMLKERNNILYT